MGNKMNVKAFLDMLFELYGDKHGVKVTYELKKKRRRRPKNPPQDKE